MVVETLPQALGMFDARWWQWIIDFGLRARIAARAAGFLLVPPGYDSPLPDIAACCGSSRSVVTGHAPLSSHAPAICGA